MVGSQAAPPATSTSTSPPAERIVVGVTGAPSCAEVIRRAAVIAERCRGDLVGVHEDDGHQPPAARHAVLTSHRELLQSLDGPLRGSVIDDALRRTGIDVHVVATDAGTGVGLGLAVARGVIDAMGGAVSVEETDGGGTTMCITLPRGDRG